MSKQKANIIKTVKNLGVNYEPLLKQKEFHESNAKFRCYAGGFGSGKTYCGAWEAFFQSIWYPNNLGLVGRMSYPELRDTTRKEFLELPIIVDKEIVPLVDSPLIKSFNKSENMIEFVNGSVVLFRALDDAFHKIKSLNLGWFWIDELTEANEEIWLGLVGRMRRKNVQHTGFGTTNPEGKDFVWKMFLQEPKEDYYLVNAPSTENYYLPDGYIERLVSQYPEEWVKRYVYGSFDTFEGLVYKDFSDKAPFVVDSFDIPDNWYKFIGIDYGYRNPMAILWCALDEKGNAYVYDEYYQTGTLISDVCDIIHTKTNKQKIKLYLIDPSTAQRDGKTGKTVQDEFNDNGIYVTPANNDKRAGINRVNEYFKLKDGKPKLKIFKNCVNLRRELQVYKWKDLKGKISSQNQPEAPNKKDDHALDALRYLVNYFYTTPIRKEEDSIVKKILKSVRGYNSELDWRAA